MKGRIFSIEEFSLYDGPGIRTTVFFKGCPLSCNWCHSPEGQGYARQIVKSGNGCLHCGKCAAVCTHPGACVLCGECVKVCPRSLIRISGEDREAEQLYKKLSKNFALLERGGGGVTFSGGEPLMQAEFLLEMLRLCEGKTHRAIQTSGYCAETTFSEVLKNVDLVLYDLKLIDEDAAKRYTGKSSAPILRNFEILKGSGVPFVVRVPLIPTVTDTEKNLTAIAERIGGAGFLKVELEPYNKFAGSKYAMCGREYLPQFDESVPPEINTKIFEERNIKVSVY